MVTDVEDIPLGARVESRISEVEGIVIERAHHISGCDRITVRPEQGVPGVPDKEYFFPVELNIVDEETDFTDEAHSVVTDTHIELGQEVRDEVTGFTGIVETINTGLWKTPDIMVGDQNGDEVSHEWFDDVRLSIMSDEVAFDFERDTENDIDAESETGPAPEGIDRQHSPN